MGTNGSTSTTSSGSKKKRRTNRVRFAPHASQFTLVHQHHEGRCATVCNNDDNDDASCSSTDSISNNNTTSVLWYTKEEFTQLAKQDVAALLAQLKESESSDTKTDKNMKNDDQSSSAAESGAKEDDERLCGRGLEMYMPGQLVIRQRRRSAYQTAALRKRASLISLYSAGRKSNTDFNDDIAIRLRNFLIVKSQSFINESRALASQDAEEAQRIYSDYGDDESSALDLRTIKITDRDGSDTKAETTAPESTSGTSGEDPLLEKVEFSTLEDESCDDSDSSINMIDNDKNNSRHSLVKQAHDFDSVCPTQSALRVVA